jgi:hypothetical protein
VDPTLAEKPLEVFGADLFTPSALTEIAAKLYNLRVARASDGSLLLTRRTRLGVDDLANIAPAVRRVTPSPLVRYVFGRLFAKEWQTVGSRPPDFTGVEVPERMRSMIEGMFPRYSSSHTRLMPDDLRQRAARYLRTYARELDRNDTLAANPVPFSRLSPDARSAVANFLIADVMEDLPRWLSVPPEYRVSR